MVDLFLARPRATPPPSAQPAVRGLGITWEGWDGSQWDLADPFGGVFLMAGVRGFTMPPVTRHTSKSPAVHGSRWRGYIADEREVFWPLYLYSDGSSQEWADFDRAFWRTMHPGRTGTWTVTQPGGASRRLRCRFVDDGQHGFDRDPAFFGWARYGVTLVAESPFWEGQAIERSWSAADPLPFYGEGGFGPPFYVSSSATIANAKLDNPGDEPAYPVWRIDGPVTNVELGVGGRQIEVPIVLDAGEWLVVDPRPEAQTAIDNTGADRTAELGEVDFAPVDPGQLVDLSLVMAGTGKVSASLTPLYWRAW